MGYPLLVALALIATGILFMVMAPPARSRQPAPGGRSEPLLAARATMELAEEMAPPIGAEPSTPSEVRPDSNTTPAAGGAAEQAAEPASAALDPALAAAEPAEWAAGAVPPEPDTAPEQPDAVQAVAADDRSLRVTWSLQGRSEERLQAMLGKVRFEATLPGLRVFDVEGDQVHAADVSLESGVASVSGLQPGRRYVVALERRSPEGDRYLIAVSPLVEI